MHRIDFTLTILAACAGSFMAGLFCGAIVTILALVQIQ